MFHDGSFRKEHMEDNESVIYLEIENKICDLLVEIALENPSYKSKFFIHSLCDLSAAYCVQIGMPEETFIELMKEHYKKEL